MTAKFFEDGLGGSITILEAGDEQKPMRFRMVMPRDFGPPAPEMHPVQREEFHVLSGQLDLGMVDGKPVVLKAGERFTLEPGTFHHPQNRGDVPCEFEGILSPGCQSAAMFAHLYTVTRKYKGFSQFLRVATIFREYRQIISFKTPLRVVMALVAAFASLAGVRRSAYSPAALDEGVRRIAS